MAGPERHRQYRRGDLVAVAVLAVAALSAVTAVWVFSDSAATVSQTAAPDATAPPAPAAAPAALSEAWRHASGATPAPVVAGPSVVTGDGSEVTGRDPLTGEPRWRYARNLPLCTVGGGWDRALAVHQRGQFCSEVTALDGQTGIRSAQRNADTTTGVRLQDNGTLAAATSPAFLEVWRSDLVRTLEYGAVQAAEQPERQPRTGCRYGSFALVTGRLGVVEHCAGESSDRLTVLVPDGKEADRPEEEFSVQLPVAGGRLVAMSTDRVAVAAPDPARLLLLDNLGAVVETVPLAVPPEEVTGDPVDGLILRAADARLLYWWTGSQTIALEAASLRPLWTLPGTLGPGLGIGADYVVPVPGGLVVVNPYTGAPVRTIPVDRAGHTGPVTLAALGPMVLEQRGGTLVALSG